MSKSVCTALIFFIMLTSTFAQDSIAKIQNNNNVNNDPKLYLRRWAGVTFGVRLSNYEEVIFADTTAVIIGSSGSPEQLIATFAFNPASLPAPLQLQFEGLSTVILSNFGSKNDSEYYELPQWLIACPKLESLALSKCQLNNLRFCERLPLKYLDLRNVQFKDRSSILLTIGSLQSLELFLYDESFSAEDILTMKERLPNTRFVAKPSDK